MIKEGHSTYSSVTAVETCDVTRGPYLSFKYCTLQSSRFSDYMNLEKRKKLTHTLLFLMFTSADYRTTPES